MFRCLRAARIFSIFDNLYLALGAARMRVILKLQVRRKKRKKQKYGNVDLRRHTSEIVK